MLLTSFTYLEQMHHILSQGVGLNAYTEEKKAAKVLTFE